MPGFSFLYLAFFIIIKLQCNNSSGLMRADDGHIYYECGTYAFFEGDGTKIYLIAYVDSLIDDAMEDFPSNTPYTLELPFFAQVFSGAATCFDTRKDEGTKNACLTCLHKLRDRLLEDLCPNFYSAKAFGGGCYLEYAVSAPPEDACPAEP